MIQPNEILEVITNVTGITSIQMDDHFSTLGIDSTKVIEVLIEFEIKYAMDILDEQLNLDELTTVQEVYDYLAHLAGDGQQLT